MFSKLEFILQAPLSLVFFFIIGPFVSYFNNRVSWTESLFDDLSGSCVIVTGANTGIGEQTANSLACRGATVVLACRSPSKGTEAADRINRNCRGQTALHNRGRAIFMELDLSNLHSVINFCKLFKEKFNRLDVLVNNAGVNAGGTSADGIMQIFQTNYLGHFLLFRELMPLLRSPCSSSDSSAAFPYRAVSRVVNLSSVMHHTGSDEFHSSAYGAGQTSVYDDSKLYMNLLTLEINKRYSDNSNKGFEGDQVGQRSILAVGVNPGAVQSDIWRNTPSGIYWAYKQFMNIFYLSPEQGSATSVYAAAARPECLSTSSSGNSYNFGKWCSHRHLPYLVPYYIPFRCLALEMLGVFAGPLLGEHSLPKNKTRIAEELWKFSDKLCNISISSISSTAKDS